MGVKHIRKLKMTDQTIQLASNIGIATDPTGSDTLLTAYSGTLKRLSRKLARYLRGNDTADDLWQDVFCRLWTRRDDIAAAEAAAIATTTARNLAIDSWRKGQRRQMLELDEQRDSQSVPSAEDNYSTHEQYVIVRQLIESELTSTQKQVLQMRDIDGLSYEEIADTLCLQETAVRMQLSRARKKIRDIYNEKYNSNN